MPQFFKQQRRGYDERISCEILSVRCRQAHCWYLNLFVQQFLCGTRVASNIWDHCDSGLLGINTTNINESCVMSKIAVIKITQGTSALTSAQISSWVCTTTKYKSLGFDQFNISIQIYCSQHVWLDSVWNIWLGWIGLTAI